MCTCISDTLRDIMVHVYVCLKFVLKSSSVTKQDWKTLHCITYILYNAPFYPPNDKLVKHLPVVYSNYR